jgi:molybdenum cofactor cytidylyltransferase
VCVPSGPAAGSPTDPNCYGRVTYRHETDTINSTVTISSPRRHAPRPTLHRVIAAIVLAAGAGTRFEGPDHKLAAQLDGVSIVDRAVRAAVDAAIGPVYVVTGAFGVELAGDLAAATVLVPNSAWADGQATSLQAGVAAARAAGATAVVVGLGDQPFVTPAAWRAVAASSTAPIGVATYAGRRGNPVRLDAVVWDLLPSSGDEGARALMRVRPDLVEPVPCPGSSADIDTREDLARWQS